MHIETLYCANSLRNFNYLVVCEQSGEALAVDPLDGRILADLAAERGWRIAWIVNTHEHFDHTAGNEELAARTGARILAHEGAMGRIPHVERGLREGETLQVGETVRLKVMDTPGHTLAHVCLFAEGDPPTLFSGDTLFNAGCGHCRSGGNPEQLFQTFRERLSLLPDVTRVYSGHDYITKNLEFAIDLEPDNQEARRLLERVRGQDPCFPFVSDLAMEKRVNPFFRLREASLVRGLRQASPEVTGPWDEKRVFLKLRELRNHW